MEKSALQLARAAYQPKLPKALQGAVKIKEGKATQSVGDQEEIKKLFPNTYGMPIVEFEPATEARFGRPQLHGAHQGDYRRISQYWWFRHDWFWSYKAGEG